MDYTELVKTLRYEATWCEDFPEQKKLFLDAANAIEELLKRLREETVDNINLTGWLAEEHANQCPHYIRNVHDRGDDSLCEKYRCEVKALPKWIPVTERLPEDLKNVLVVDDGRVSIGHCEHYYGEEEVFVEWHDNLYYPIDPPYWMPIPEPPKEET